MRKPTLAGIVVLALTAAVLWPRDASLPAVPGAAPAATPAPAVREHAGGPAPAVGERRAAVDAAPDPAGAITASAEAGPRSTAIAPWTLRVLVVDRGEQPVAEATVAIRAMPRAATGHPLQEPLPPALQELRTDSDGTIETRLEAAEVVVQATVADGRVSRHSRAWPRSGSVQAMRLVLERTARLTGRVLFADDSPIRGARVTAMPIEHPTVRGEAPVPAPVFADESGGFQFEVLRGVTYRIAASHSRGHAAGEAFPTIASDEPPPIVLRAAGAISVNGVVVDPGGAAVRARLWMWRRSDADIALRERVRSSATDAAGRFSLPAGDHAHYVLFAASDEHGWSSFLEVETTAARPHANVRIVLGGMAPIAGHVLDARGAPIPNARIAVEADAERTLAIPTDGPGLDLLLDDANTATDAGGRFSVLVPAGTYTVAVRPRPEFDQLVVRRTAVPAGTRDLAIQVTDEEPSGCVVRGTVDVDPARLPASLWLVTERDGHGTRGGQVDPRWSGTAFELPPLARGRGYALRIDWPDSAADPAAPALAPTLLGPFRTDRARLEFEIRPAPFATQPLRVHEAGGAPALALHGTCTRRPMRDRDRAFEFVRGAAELAGLAAGRYHLRLLRDDVVLHEVEVDVEPGLNPEAIVRLPAR